MTKRYNITAAKADTIRAELTRSGITGARVRRMPNGAARIVLRSVEDRDAARDAFVMADLCSAAATPFTSPKWAHLSNGPVEFFVWSLTP
jgi:hypothetical protein